MASDPLGSVRSAFVTRWTPRVPPETLEELARDLELLANAERMAERRAVVAELMVMRDALADHPDEMEVADRCVRYVAQQVDADLGREPQE